MEQLLPEPVAGVDLEQAYAVPDGPWLRLDMVASVDGTTVLDGTSRTLSGPADRAVFRTLRGLADAVLVGAGTARAESYGTVPLAEDVRARRTARGQAERPVLVVVSRSLDVEPVPGSVVVTTGSADDGRARRLADAGVDVVRAGEDEVDLAAGLAALRARGLDHVLAEGGPSLNAALLAADLVDELCLTTSPSLVGPGPALSGAEHPRRPLRLAGLLHDDGWLFARWHVVR